MLNSSNVENIVPYYCIVDIADIQAERLAVHETALSNSYGITAHSVLDLQGCVFSIRLTSINELNSLKIS